MSKPLVWLGKWAARIAHFVRGSPRSRERLADFRGPGQWVPLAALLLVGLLFFIIWGFDAQLSTLLELCAAYAVAHFCLAALARSQGGNPPWRQIIVVAMFGVVTGGCVSAVIALAPEWDRLASFETFASAGRMGAAFSAFFVGLSLAMGAMRQKDQSELDMREQLLEARLKMLTARIEPHFMMNTLANVHSLVETDSAAAKNMLGHLSSLLQGALERSRDLNTTLGQEIKLIESYLSIMQMRLGDRLQFELDVDEVFHPVRFPALLLQTLVENAIRHGIEPSGRPGHIAIRAESRGDRVQLRVVDDGVGFDAASRSGGGEGWRNVTERLETFYRGSAEFHIDSTPGAGTEVTLIVPREAG